MHCSCPILRQRKELRVSGRDTFGSLDGGNLIYLKQVPGGKRATGLCSALGLAFFLLAPESFMVNSGAGSMEK